MYKTNKSPLIPGREAMNRARHGKKLLEELDLFDQAQYPGVESSIVLDFPAKDAGKFKSATTEAFRFSLQKKKMPLPDSAYLGDGATNQKWVFCFRKWKGFRVPSGIHQRRLRCMVCLQVHQIKGLPLSMEGRYVTVNWRKRGWERDQTLHVQVCQGIANFNEIFLHYCNFPCNLKDFTIWVSSVDAKNSDLGSFQLEASLPTVKNLNSISKFGGKTMSFKLRGIAEGGILITKFYYRIIQTEFNEWQEKKTYDLGFKKGKNRCCSCLPDFQQEKNRALIGSNRRVLSLESDLDFITIENVGSNHCPTGEDDEDFITIERGTGRASSRKSLKGVENGSEEERGIGEKNPSFIMGFDEEFDVVEDEFIRMLEENQVKTGSYVKSSSTGPCCKEGKEKLILDLDLDSVMRAAELELLKATQFWKSKAEARVIERSEYEELIKRWGLIERAFGSSSLDVYGGFGSPIY